jgi:hypothetical protein
MTTKPEGALGDERSRPCRPWERPARKIGADAFAALESLSSSELTSLLLELFARRARKLSVHDIRRRFESDAFVTPSTVSQRAFTNLDAHLLAQLPPKFEAVELSPLAPHGTVSTLGPVHPHNVMATIRGQEVLADATDVMALMCARLRDEREEVHLATSQRLVRAQRVRETFHTQHFRILSLCSAGRGDAFAMQTVVEHIRIQLHLFSTLPPEFRRVSLRVTLAAENFDELRAMLGPEVIVDRDEERLVKTSYYQRVAFKVWVDDLPLGDGGFTDWTAKLRNDKRERLVTSAIGTEMLLKGFLTASSG